MLLYEPDLHEPLSQAAWSQQAAETAIHEIIKVALNEFQQENLWSVHPDLQESYGIKQPLTGLWFGAAGTIWAIHRLQQVNSQLPTYDFKPYLSLLRTKQPQSLREFAFGFDPEAPGYLIGYAGADLVHWQLTQDPAVLKTLAEGIKRNIHHPANELMWAAPGTALAAWFLYQKTRDPVWAQLFQTSADYLFATWQYYPDSQLYLWPQDMYGSAFQYLGLVHGIAGNISVLLQGFDLLNARQQAQLIDWAQHSFIKTAHTDNRHANWKPCAGEAWSGGDKFFLQLCHGAPSMVIGLAKLWPYMNPAAKTLYLKAAQLIWDAGPLKKPWGLCHGTAGNGYAFLKCYHLTGDAIWLNRARQFAMHAITQSQAMQKKYGRIRPDNWCGDLGLALYLQDCIHEKSEFPLLDYFF